MIKQPRSQALKMIMLKVEPRFKFDQPYKGPYRIKEITPANVFIPYKVKEVTPTNVFIQQINDPSSDVLDVSIQRVSRCSNNLETATHWLGNSGIDISSKSHRFVAKQATQW